MRDVELFLRLLAHEVEFWERTLPDVPNQYRMDFYIWLMRCSELARDAPSIELFFHRLTEKRMLQSR